MQLQQAFHVPHDDVPVEMRLVEHIQPLGLHAAHTIAALVAVVLSYE